MNEIETLLTVVRAAGRAGVPVLLWGTPGTGKSALVETPWGGWTGCTPPP